MSLRRPVLGLLCCRTRALADVAFRRKQHFAMIEWWLGLSIRFKASQSGVMIESLKSKEVPRVSGYSPKRCLVQR